MTILLIFLICIIILSNINTLDTLVNIEALPKALATRNMDPIIKDNDENLFVVAYNNGRIPDILINTNITIQDIEFSKIFNDQATIVDKTFQLYNSNIEFPFNNNFKKLALDYFNSKVAKTTFLNDNFYISNNINTIRYKFNDDDTIVYICNFNLTNSTKIFTKKIQIGILTDSNSKPIKLLFMKLDSSIVATNDFSPISFLKPFDPLRPKYYTIKNKMHLMDPWITTRGETTEFQKNVFNNILIKKNAELLNLESVNRKLI
jgi:hypothetical protein